MSSFYYLVILGLLLVAGSLPATDLQIWNVEFDSSVPVLPDTVPTSNEAAKVPQVLLVGTPGEYESASFAVRTDSPVKLEFTLPTLAGQNTVVAPGALSLRYVVCHWQSGPWNDLFRVRGQRNLVPELLVNDPELIRVNLENKTNEVRLDFPSGAKYVNVSEECDSPITIWNANIPVSEFPLKDAPLLQPAQLDSGFTRQMLLTVHIPEDTAPGLYSGKLFLGADGVALRSIEVKLRVLPFRLCEPHTRYNPDEPFFSNLYSYGCLDGGDGNIAPFHRSREQLEREFHNQVAHGVPYSGLYQGQISEDETILREVLKLRQACGMATRPVFFLGPENNLGAGTDNSPAQLEKLAHKVRKYCDLVEEVYGHREVYFYGIDEAGDDTVSQQQNIWRVIQDNGGKVFAAGFPGKTFAVAGNRLNMIVCGGFPNAMEAAQWHAAGNKIMAYGCPQTAVEEPSVYRRNYGLSAWLSDYDGVMPYAYYSCSGHPWNDFDSELRDMNFVYPTADGVIDTLAWEAYREAIDDIRYASTLMLAIRDAAPEKKAIADEALHWLDTLEVYAVPAKTIRLTMIDYILRLKGEK